MGVALMANPKKTAPKGAGRKPSGQPRKAVAVTLKGSEEWKAWIEALARHSRLDVAKLIDRAVIEFAKKEGFEPEAPER